jgi:hypothetical protein
MYRTKTVCGWLVIGIALTSPGNAHGQAGGRRKGGGGAGSTIEGDLLKGEGKFLKGASWYELRSSKARAKDADTQLKWEKWNKDLADESRQDFVDRASRKLANRNTRDANAGLALAEFERKLRENPSIDDVRSGDALNALLIDLSNPKITLSGPSSEDIALPQDFSLRHVVYRFVGARGGSRTSSMSGTVLDLQKLRAHDSWPLSLKMAALKQARDAYERAIRAVVGECKTGNLNLDSVLTLETAIAELKDGVGTIVPTGDGMRANATRFVSDLEKGAKMFKTLDFAQELVGDIEQHDAHTVLELLAFMRKFRLLFADTEKLPQYARLYEQLYSLLKQQKEKLGLKGEPLPPSNGDVAMVKAKPADRPDSSRIKAKEHLEKVKENLKDLKYPGRPKRAKSRDDALSTLDATIKDIDKGPSAAERLDKLRKQIESLQDVSTKSPSNVKNLKEATDSLAAAIKSLQ